MVKLWLPEKYEKPLVLLCAYSFSVTAMQINARVVKSVGLLSLCPCASPHRHGQLGHGGLESEQQPRLVEALAGVPMRAVAAGGWHSASVSGEGPWGRGWRCRHRRAGCPVSSRARPVLVPSSTRPLPQGDGVRAVP